MNQSSKVPAATWHKAMDAAALAAKGRAVVRLGGKQIALFHREGTPFACNNRCPHEGYPLAEGTLDHGCVLTCNWHNWKFDLSSGENLMGFDELPVYATKIVDGTVWVALTEEPAEARVDKARRALRGAYDDHDYERIARELARLRRAGADPVGGLVDAIAWSHDRFEFGMTHAYAGAAEWLALHDEAGADATTRLACLTEAIGFIAWDALRHKAYPYARRTRAWSEAGFVDAVEAEDEARAIAHARGGLRSGMRLADMRRAMATAALRHYSDFGHSLIYVQKAAQLSTRLGPAVDEPLALALTRALVMGFREDKIPEFRRYAAARAAWGRPRAAVADSVVGLGVGDALAWTVARSSTMAPEDLHRALLHAGAHNLLHWDTRLEGRWDNAVSTNVG
jgi:nitrite reductase/ring-hydroxylating ferredoxin subunit